MTKGDGDDDDLADDAFSEERSDFVSESSERDSDGGGDDDSAFNNDGETVTSLQTVASGMAMTNGILFFILVTNMVASVCLIRCAFFSG